MNRRTVKLLFWAAAAVSLLPACSSVESVDSKPSFNTSLEDRPEVATGSNLVRRDKNAMSSNVRQADKDGLEIRRAPVNTGGG
ncbi:hypothetical protein LNV09_08300 [Paucibacter sp. B2R-40]|uniref:hypothetical protein n=1 Tax=Paucibacter sp. B2R-40 TaxID=2893554 RepID=UPI0021E3E363|nr:hypothetical protein [Paucibacter sp. B2R-40]MCV2354166.1 hypothetical protein [Paucibacter sp. B2R-40]